MDTTTHNKLVAFIWSIADDCLRDVYVRGKYRDVILPMVVLRRIDALLEPTKEAVLEEVKFQREELKFTELDAAALKDASKQVFYNTSKWTLQLLKTNIGNSRQIAQTDFEDYLNGFSKNVKEIIKSFNLKSKVEHMISKDVWLDVLEKFTSKNINLTPFEAEDAEGRKLPPLSNLGMGYVFEELIRKFNEENNEEAGEHFTPREVIDLMTHLIFEPIKDNLPSVMTIYDPACGSGGMLTESQNFIQDEEGAIKANGSVYLYGKEINDETYAICKSDMMIRGNSPENIHVGSTLSRDSFAGTQFNYMLSNPPYGKSWASEQKHIKDGKDVIDNRFIVNLDNYWGETETVEAVPRSSDGQLLFLMEMVSKMKPNNEQTDGSRIASVHNGSSLFTGDAGGGESNIRRYIIENDMLEAIIQLPNNLFYNTGITTYIWLLSNAKAENRKGKVQLIDASEQYTKLRKNLGAKNCELTKEHIQEILNTHINFETTEPSQDKPTSKVFDNEDFGFYKVSIERPKRLKAQFSEEKINTLRYDKHLTEPMQWAYETYGDKVYTEMKQIGKEIVEWAEKNGIDLNSKKRTTLTSPKTWKKQKTILEAAQKLMKLVGTEEYSDFNIFQAEVEQQIKDNEMKLSSSEKNAIYNAITWYDETAEKVIKKTQKLKDEKLEALLDRLDCTEEQLSDYGYYATKNKGEYIIYETESDLRDYENIPLKESIYSYFLEEVKPHVEEAWIDLEKTKIGYEISFNKYFYQHKPLRNIETVNKEILELEKQNEGLILEILNLS
ncbi:type I restriction-modification system subunit M [Bernardetia sp.]|uniref:type I restriction-modification system subunit M n=1 Tax=Bernardetia sp. TaxID=1937974 RepID=UPI0025C56C23|nr:class I SAM-dependent DNA methyltransferase [Bernardetia sp.]